MTSEQIAGALGGAAVGLLVSFIAYPWIYVWLQRRRDRGRRDG